jgi:hypothetical protein
MTNDSSNKQSFNISIFEQIVGPLQSIEHDLSGPFPHIRRGKLYMEVAVEATILGSNACLVMRFHVLQQRSLGTPSSRLKLRPANIDDEFESINHSAISELLPDYHITYKSRFLLNSVILAMVLQKDSQLQNRLHRKIH